MIKKTDNFNVRIGTNLRHIRESKKLTQTEVAYVLKVSPEKLAKYEAGTNKISASTLYKLSQYYYKDMGYFFQLMLNLIEIGHENEEK
jgi:transcriptional regulator with XRE-family HTH domain